METEKKERESPNDSTLASEESSEEETETAELKGKQSLGGPRKNDDSESPSSPEPAMPGKHVEKTVEKAVSFGSNIPAPLASASVAPSSGSPGEEVILKALRDPQTFLDQSLVAVSQNLDALKDPLQIVRNLSEESGISTESIQQGVKRGKVISSILLFN
ncbi:unnamed protein product [Lupinus luteus]|uniref:Uncharacterized protein n=1 Tax=Lupinus luteus TaxID=3873 RepID=A0AAV1X0G1_LUPLU